LLVSLSDDVVGHEREYDTVPLDAIPTGNVRVLDGRGRAAATDLPSQQTAGGLFVGLRPPNEVLYGFDTLDTLSVSNKNNRNKSKAGVSA
jgi:hypothetical protein